MDTINPLLFVTIVTLVSGVGGTGIGGLVGALFNSESNRVVSLLLAFAGGVMTAIVCFNLIQEAIEAAFVVGPGGIWLVISMVAVGIITIGLLNYVIDRKTRNKVKHVESSDHPKTHDDIDELIHADNLIERQKNHESRLSLAIAGIVMACAIALHNLPEGMTIGASFAISTENLYLGTGMIMAVLIGLHNIPEGMAVAVPLISGGMSKIKAIIITASCGIPTLIGAWLGFMLGDVGPVGLACSLGFASGAMLYVVYSEILPEAYLIYKSKAPAFACLVGILLGMAIIF